MKKLNDKGFVLAETLIVTVFILTIFTMIYTYYYPIIGLYEERETYDDVDGKYVAYWVKQLIENDSYNFNNGENEQLRKNQMNHLGYIRFECDDVSENDNRRKICKNLVNALEISKCDMEGNNCDIFITHFQIGGTPTQTIHPDFKKTISGKIPQNDDNTVEKDIVLRKYHEEIIDDKLCAYAETSEEVQRCKNEFLKDCFKGKGYVNLAGKVQDNGEVILDAEDSTKKNITEIINYCKSQTESKVFPTYIADYINFLPNYTADNYNTGSKYRVIVVVQHKKALNNYYSFSTMEVNR